MIVDLFARYIKTKNVRGGYMSRFNDAVTTYESSKSEVLFESYFTDVCCENGIPHIEFMIVKEGSVMETIRNFFKRVWEYIRKGYEAIARFFSDLIKKVLRKDDSEDAKKDNAKDLRDLKQEKDKSERELKKLKDKRNYLEEHADDNPYMMIKNAKDLEKCKNEIEILEKKIEDLNDKIVHLEAENDENVKPGNPVDFSRGTDKNKFFTYLPTSKIKNSTVNAKELIFTDIGNVSAFAKALADFSDLSSIGPATELSESSVKTMVEEKFNEHRSSEKYPDKLSYASVINNQIAYRAINAKTTFTEPYEVINYLKRNDELGELLFDISKYINQVIKTGDEAFKFKKDSNNSTIENSNLAMQLFTKQSNLLSKYFADSQKELMLAKCQIDVLGHQAIKIDEKAGFR